VKKGSDLYFPIDLRLNYRFGLQAELQI
jgi:hypothetical protein